jgi:MarR family
MSSTGMAWARQQRAGNPTAKATLLLLGELVGDDGTTTRSQTQLAEILECTRQTAGRALVQLEERGLIRRERRQASDTKRLPDKITLAIQGAFTVEPLPNDVPEEEPETVPDESERSKNEHSKIEQREGSKIEQREGSKIEQSINSSFNSPLTQTGDGAASGTAQAGKAMELPGMPPRQDLVKAQPKPEQQIAAWAYEQTGKGLKYQAMMLLGKEAISHGYQPGEVAKTMVALFKSGRNVNAQSLAQALRGIITPTGQRPTPSTTDARVATGLALRDQLRAMEETQSR